MKKNINEKINETVINSDIIDVLDGKSFEEMTDEERLAAALIVKAQSDKISADLAKDRKNSMFAGALAALLTYSKTKDTRYTLGAAGATICALNVKSLIEHAGEYRKIMRKCKEYQEWEATQDSDQ